MQHTNKHAIGQAPGYWSAGRLKSVADDDAVDDAPQERLRNEEGGEEVPMSLTPLDSTPGCVVSSTILDSSARNSRSNKIDGFLGVLDWLVPSLVPRLAWQKDAF